MAEVGKRLDYNEVRTTERWINTQGESACQALKGKGRKGLYKVFQPKRMRCRDSTKYARRGCIGMLQRLYKVYNWDRVIQDLKATDYWRN
jgi:hypothetical protein